MKKGSRVVCVDDSIRAEIMPSVIKYYKNWVAKDKTYTIREILQNEGIVEGVLLEEIRNEPIYIDLVDKKQEPAFGMFRFKLLQDDMLLESVEYYIEML
jgi:hypothetical protein